MSAEVDLFAGLPWAVITEYASVQEVLQARLVCRDWCLAVTESVGLDWCAQHLSQCLRDRNLYLLTNTNSEWKTSVTQTNVTDLLVVQANSSSTSCLDQWLRVLRVMKHLPASIAVAFSAKYGRHCVPMTWDDQTKTSAILNYSKCQTPNCPTCQLKPPARKEKTKNDSIDHHLELHNKRGPIDLTHYAPKCIPNIPSDLTCPHCRTRDRRTLVLSEFSYQSAPAAATDRPNNVQLTWTPRQDDETDGELISEEEEDSSNYKDHTTLSPPAAKRSKLESVADEDFSTPSSSFPPSQVYDDMAIPIRHEPIRLKSDSKHAMSMHCVQCQKFAILAPAGVCLDREIVCPERGRHLDDSTILGGVLVRTQCTLPDCHKPIGCSQCAHHTWHDAYDGGERIRRLSHCDTCKQVYCDEHAWISIVCHHLS
jgi:hypothetical protein